MGGFCNLCLCLDRFSYLHAVCYAELIELVMLEPTLQTRVPPVLNLVARPVWQTLGYPAPAGPVLQEVCHDDNVLLVRKGLLRPGFELKNVSIAALFI